MKALLLSHQSELHQQLLSSLHRLSQQASLARTHALASALPYLRQEPDIEVVVLDVALCGWSRVSTLVTTLRPCLGHRKLALLVDDEADAARLRAQGLTVDACLVRSVGETRLAEQLLRLNEATPALTAARWTYRPPKSVGPASGAMFTRLAW